jgi:AraC family transcriptional activator of pobA
MRKKMDLKAFNLYQYLKEQQSQNFAAPYFLADQATYANASIKFPFRTFTYGIGITYSGKGGAFRIGSTTYQTQAGSLCTIGPGIVSQWMGEYDSIHDTIYFTEELFKNSLKISFLKSLPFFLPGGSHIILLSDEYVEKMRSLMDSLKQFREDADIVTGLVYSLLMLTARCHRFSSARRSSSTSIKEKIAGDFKSLLAQNFLEKKDVAFYADQLNITPKYLSEVLIAETGQTAKTLIDEHLFMEARSLLRQTSMTIQEICHWLGYADSSYFTKAFKKKEGMTPLEYRKL